jgi:uncharacterized protein (TIGR02453 family)
VRAVTSRRQPRSTDTGGNAADFKAFSPKALAFLRALKRNNDREWFRARKDRYEAELRAPMAALVSRLAGDFRAFAPDLIADPRTAIYRIYRDTRFSDNGTPLKTNVAAIFPCRGLGKHQGAGLYLEVAPGGVWVGGGMYSPDTSQLQAVREHIAANHRRLRAIVEAPAFLRVAGPLHGDQLQRIPRGFAKDHPAAEFLKYRQFMAGREFPATFATTPRFYAGVLAVFRQVAPLTTFLNEALIND